MLSKDKEVSNVCVHVLMCIVYTCITYVRIHTHIYIHVYVCIPLHIYLYIHAYTHRLHFGPAIEYRFKRNATESHEDTNTEILEFLQCSKNERTDIFEILI